MSAGEVYDFEGVREKRATARATTTGSFSGQAVNPLGNPCPVCQARRYERCFEWKGMIGEKFLDVLPEPHDRRVPLKVGTWLVDELREA